MQIFSKIPHNVILQCKNITRCRKTKYKKPYQLADQHLIIQTSISWICSGRGSSNLCLRGTILSLSSYKHYIYMEHQSGDFLDLFKSKGLKHHIFWKLTLFESFRLNKACPWTARSWAATAAACFVTFGWFPLCIKINLLKTTSKTVYFMLHQN